MGIDPVTHEPLHTETSEENSKTESSDDQNHVPLDHNSCNLMFENDPLITCLFRDDPPQFDFPSPQENLNNFWDEWLLMDCQDFGIHDFGFDCFNDMEINTALDSLEMGKEQ